MATETSKALAKALADVQAQDDPAKALAEARRLWMAENGATGVKGIARADVALHATNPALFTEYAAKLSEGAKK